MTERGIIFSGPMVQAVLRDVDPKTQTRRLARQWLKVRKGDRFWVREDFCIESDGGTLVTDEQGNYTYLYRERNPEAVALDENGSLRLRSDGTQASPWTSSMMMPRRASRIDLEATADAREELLRDISAADEIAEGIRPAANSLTIDCATPDPREEFARLWDSLHTKPGKRWADNPKVVVLTFRRLKP